MLRIRCHPSSLLQSNIRVKRGAFAGVTDTNDKFARIDGPPASCPIPEDESARAEVEHNVFCLAGREKDLLQALEFALGPGDRGEGI